MVHYITHMDWHGIDGGPPRYEAGDQPPETLHGLLATPDA